jgi:hypothetical protein
VEIDALYTVCASIPPVTMEPLNEGTVPEVYTIPLDVHAPLAVAGSDAVHVEYMVQRTQDGALSSQVGHYRLLSELGCGFSNDKAGHHEEGRDDGSERDHDRSCDVMNIREEKIGVVAVDTAEVPWTSSARPRFYKIR